jgi:hypothetical protein
MPDKQNKPLNEEEIGKHPDNKIDQDFKGFPTGPANESTIKPGSPEENETADTHERDGEKRIIRPDERQGLDEQDSDGSASAFEDK